MPESKLRKEAAQKKQERHEAEDIEAREEKKKVSSIGTRKWVPPTFITLGLLGVIWIVVYYIAGQTIPFLASLGQWNMAIGFGLMISSFIVATLWK